MHIQRQADSFAFRMAAEDFSVPVNDLTSRLRGEFDEWAEPKRAAGEIGPWPRDLVGYWPYVERFLKDKYPVAFQGFDMGQEEAGPGLNRRKNNPYPTGPEAIEQYGYDPKEIAAGMLMLHLGPRDYSKTPKNVLVNIFKTRQKMQRAYDQAHVAIRLAHNTIRCAMPMMYHRTEPEWAKSIYEDKEFGGPNSVWFSDRPTGEGEVYGPAIVQLNIPDEVLKNHGEVEGEFPSGEKHWRVDLDAIKPEYFVDRAIKEADDLILYHGTGADSVPHIQQNGLMHPPGVSPAGWPMLTTDFDQAKAYATRDNPVVLEYHVPANLTYGRWRTHRTGEEPYLWDAEPHTAYDYPAQSYALKRPLPATFLRAVHPVQRKMASHNTIRCAADIPSLTDTWKDFVDWAGGNEDEAYVGAQWWPNLEQYLSDRHGLSNDFQYTEDKDEYYSHPMVLQMGKIHALAHSREDVTPDISEDEKLEAAAMGLINLRKRVDQQRQNLIDDPNSPYYYDPGEWV